jgi:hypothetical protein
MGSLGCAERRFHVVHSLGQGNGARSTSGSSISKGLHLSVSCEQRLDGNVATPSNKSDICCHQRYAVLFGGRCAMGSWCSRTAPWRPSTPACGAHRPAQQPGLRAPACPPVSAPRPGFLCCTLRCSRCHAHRQGCCNHKAWLIAAKASQLQCYAVHICAQCRTGVHR